MERNVQIIRRMIPVFLAVILGISGCQKTTSFDHEYKFEDRLVHFANHESDGFSRPFAESICVPTGINDTDTLLTADAAAVFEIDGTEVVFERSATERMNPASTTKIMTAIVALKYGNLEDLVTVTDDAIITEAGSSMAGVKPGDVMRLEDLLYGLMIPSGNDAANAIAVHIGGSIEGFVEMMNEEAHRIGATATHFKNANGLTDPDHYTTAYDLYLLFCEALKYDTFRTIIGAHAHNASYFDALGNPKTASWGVGNYYMNGKREAPDGVTVFGGKTGTTQAAGYCLIMGSRMDDGREFASVVMKADSRNALYDDMTQIISKIDK
ncbi:MAG: D-alanyl-D-alanine carboxypeptidase [Lachnospiraceae bacterium]|nr:D-alanyl-D-alanine carboxypeptidase [Lachnospiraceae bacterium]